MGGLIFSCIVLFIIIQSVKKSASQNGGAANRKTGDTVSKSRMPAATNTPYRSRNTSQNTLQNTSQNTSQYASQNAPQNTSQYISQSKSLMPEKTEGNSTNSTTEYLAQKAKEDAVEHAREKYEEQKRLQESRGGLAVAERLIEGDSVPRGKQCVICGYCAAENLIPMVPRGRYSCYFCREPL